MSNKTTYTKNKVAELITGKTAFTLPAGSYLALFSTATSDAGGGTELAVANGYARQSVTWGTSVTGLISNTGAVVFTNTGSAWSAATHWAIMDASTAGNMIAHKAFAASKTVGASQTLTIPIGDLDLQEE